MVGALERLWRLLFAERCLGCGARDEVVCAACERSLVPSPPGYCPGCGRSERLGALCGRCRQQPQALEALVAATMYQGVARRAIHQFKFRQGRYLAPFLASLLARALRTRPLQVDLVVPVPLSKRRLRARGYNQSELLAAALLQIDPLNGARLEPGALERIRDSVPQFRLSAADRAANVRGAFACRRPELIAGRRLLLVDDVCTTGATLRECARTLRQAGASRVMAAVVARAVD